MRPSAVSAEGLASGNSRDAVRPIQVKLSVWGANQAYLQAQAKQ